MFVCSRLAGAQRGEGQEVGEAAVERKRSGGEGMGWNGRWEMEGDGEKRMAGETDREGVREKGG